MVDDRTGLKLSDIFQEKNGMIQPKYVQFMKWRQGGQPVRLMRYDNAG